MVRLIIVDETRLYREALARSLDRQPDIELVGLVSHLDALLASTQELRPDIILLHAAIPQSLPILRILASKLPDVKTVILDLLENDHDVIACAEAGMAGYLPRDGSIGDLIETIKTVAKGEIRCPPRVAATLLRRVGSLAAEYKIRAAGSRLTPREREIVRLIDQGLSNKEISQRLTIEVRTVKNHVHNILEKLQVHRRGEAAARLRDGLMAASI